MDYKFGKTAARICVEQICEGMRQYARELRDDKSLTIDEFAERITICVLRELSEQHLPIDPQKMIAIAMGMVHASMQTIAINVPIPPEQSGIDWDPVPYDISLGRVH